MIRQCSVCSQAEHVFIIMKNIKKNIKNKICIVVYDDAAYFIKDFNPKNIPIQNISIGKVRRLTKDFIDLIFYEDSKDSIHGIVIPIKAIISCKELIYTL